MDAQIKRWFNENCSVIQLPSALKAKLNDSHTTYNTIKDQTPPWITTKKLFEHYRADYLLRDDYTTRDQAAFTNTVKQFSGVYCLPGSDAIRFLNVSYGDDGETDEEVPIVPVAQLRPAVPAPAAPKKRKLEDVIRDAEDAKRVHEKRITQLQQHIAERDDQLKELLETKTTLERYQTEMREMSVQQLQFLSGFVEDEIAQRAN